jgi:hypothetical protein
MELLRKTITNPADRKLDNADKTMPFAKDRHPHKASTYRDEWSFIQDTTLRENIAYQLQYLEFMIHLYNDYQIYLTIESLLCKDLMVAIAGIVEAALFDIILSARKAKGLSLDNRTDFTALLGQAYHDYGLMDRHLWHFFHDLRKVRNNIHLCAADFREHTAYTVDQVNDSITMLEEFRLRIKGTN